MRTCDVEGCNGVHEAKGWCRKHYLRMHRYNTLELTHFYGRTTLERFEEKIDKSSGYCWKWTGCRDQDGYGQLGIGGGKQVKAHRFSYETYVGKIGEGLHVCHSCDVPSCVNPEHLWTGTDKDNAVDRQNKGRGIRGVTQWKSKLTEEEVLEIRKLHKKISNVDIAKLYCVGPDTIGHIMRRNTWKHI